MNKIFTVLLTVLIFTASISKAQNVNWDTLPYTQHADWKLTNLNKNLVTTNILYDRVLPIADITHFKAI